MANKNGKPRGTTGKWRRKPGWRGTKVTLLIDKELYAWWKKTGRVLNLSTTLSEAVRAAKAEYEAR